MGCVFFDDIARERVDDDEARFADARGGMVATRSVRAGGGDAVAADAVTARAPRRSP